MTEVLVSPVILDNEALQRLGSYQFGAGRRQYIFAPEAWLVTGRGSAIVYRIGSLISNVAQVSERLGRRDVKAVVTGSLVLVGRPRELPVDVDEELTAIARQTGAEIAAQPGCVASGPLYIGSKEIQAFEDAGTAVANARSLDLDLVPA